MQTPFSAVLDARKRPTRLVLSGELDVATSVELRLAVRDAIRERTMSPPLHIDCRDLEFIDGSGIGALLAARRWASAREVPVFVVDPSRNCRRLLEILDLTHLVAA